MTLTFVDTHNMIAYLTKSDASEGFNQVINFLNGSSIKYALTINPNIYVSCIKQFWTSVAVKKINDVTRLQALVDKKKVVITEATFRDALRLDDAEGVECLPNEEIFAELARMGYEKPSTKLTFYKAFFSSHWKFLIHTILQCMSAKRTSWNEFSSSMASAVICLSTCRNFNFSKKQVGDLSSHTIKYSSPALTQKVFANMKRVDKGFSRVETPLFEGMIVEQQVGEGADEVNVEDVSTGGVATEGAASVANDEGRMIADMDADKDVTLKDVAAVAKDVKDAEIEEITAAIATITPAASQLTTAAAPTLTTAPSAASAARRRKGVVIRDPEESATPSTIIHTEAKSKDNGKGILVEEPKPLKKQDQIEQDEAYARELERYQVLKRKPQTEAQARKNMMIYIRNVAGFKMYYFKGMTYDDIRPIFEKYFDSNVAFLQKTKEQMEEEDSRALTRLSESQEDKTAKKQKLDEEVEELKRHLQIVPNDEDDAYTEATPLALKVSVVDYEIYTENNKPYFKIKRVDERRYPLTRFTLDQMLNNVRLEVEEESEVSLELLSFGVDVAEEFKENMLSDYCCQVKLMMLINAAKSS
nr:hypothetical protein [Tanacetum cinerariifolium]